MKEIERKFVVNPNSGWEKNISGKSTFIAQGYLSPNVRVRTINDKAVITIKEKTDNSWIRDEFEYEIPYADSRQLFNIAKTKGNIIYKTRYPMKNNWIVDVFHGKHVGVRELILAEIEIKEGENWPAIPDWVGLEVTERKDYSNSYLFEHGFNSEQYKLDMDAILVHKV